MDELVFFRGMAPDPNTFDRVFKFVILGGKSVSEAYKVQGKTENVFKV